MNWKRPLGMAAIAALCAAPAYGQLRICNYNLRGDSGTLGAGFDKVLAGIGNDNTAGFAKPIDVVLVQETDAQSTTTQEIVDILNSIYGAGVYARGTIDAATTGSGRPGIVYRTSSLSLVAELQVGTASTSGAARAPMRYQFRPVGYDSSADFYIYNSHYKASDASSDRTRRLAEAHLIRQNADSLGQGARIIYGGDFNSYYSSEPMFVGGSGSLGLQSAGNGQAHDPLNAAGTWNNNAAFVSIATQAPLSSPPPATGFVGGGLNSRFDMQYLTDEMLSGEGVSYLTGSYHTFMNNGSVPLNNSINVAANNAQPSLPNRSQVLTALTTATDHLPLVVDYQVPAKMSVSVGTVSPSVITGAAVNVSVSVSNSATALTVAGADELDYTGSGAGKLSGTISGMDNALGGANAHALPLNTSTPGLAVGTISVTATSAGAASANFSQPVNVTVLAHANPTLSSASDTDSATIDFGIYAGGAGTATSSFALQNHPDASGYTAALKLVSISGSGATSMLTTNAATFGSLAAGASNVYSAMMALGSYGTFSATYTFATADQDLPGATARENLLLTLNGVVALGGDANLDGFVETSDFNTLAGNFGAASATWNEGDFNRDALVDSMDFAVLAGSYGQRVNMAAPSLGAVVPEPSALGVALIILSGQVRRRK
jgi:hypothetical protein